MEDMFCVFFFSSRRRHTRFDCDWSSDVCSSDLLECRCSAHQGLPAGGDPRQAFLALLLRGRSEERRVGKECRSRWAAYNLKKKKQIIIDMEQEHIINMYTEQ